MQYRLTSKSTRSARKWSTTHDIAFSITNLFHGIVPPDNHTYLTLEQRRLDELEYLRAHNPVRLRKFHALIARLSSGEGAYDALHFIRTRNSTFYNEDVETLYAYRELLVHYPLSIIYVRGIHALLVDTFGLEPDSNGRVPTLEAHLRAKLHYEKHLGIVGVSLKLEEYESWQKYEGNEAYVRAVEQYASQVDTLMKYREERGILITHGVDNFDPNYFAQYLSHSALSDGWV